MITIQTVTGPVDSGSLGHVLPHEHVAFYFDRMDEYTRNMAVDHHTPYCRDLVVKYGCNAMVEVTPRRVTDGSCRRPMSPGWEIADYEIQRRLTHKTGMHFIASTGYYVEGSRPAEFATMTTAALAKSMVKDIQHGIGNTGVKAGIIKIAVDDPESESDNKLLQAAAIAQKETGASITTHTCHPAIRTHTLDVLEAAGVPPARITLGHADTNSSLVEALALAKRGCMLLYTIWGITRGDLIGWRYGTDVPRYWSAYLARALADEGYLEQLMISIDY